MTDNPSPPAGLTPGGGCRTGPRTHPLARAGRDPGIAAIPQNIAAMTAFHGMSEALVAERAGIGEGAWARRKARPELWTLAELRRVAELLGVDVSRLTRVES